MAHSFEWAIGYVGGLEKGGNWGRGREPVDHFGEWTTSSSEIGRNRVKSPKSREPVVHSGEWTTSSSEQGSKQSEA